MGRVSKYPAELRERAVRMVAERPQYPSQWAAITAVAGMLGIGAPETLRTWIRRSEVDTGARSARSATRWPRPPSGRSRTKSFAGKDHGVTFKNEVIRRQGPWRDVNQVEIATAEWVVWFNTERPHEYLDDFTPEAGEKLHYDHRRTPPKAG